MSVFFWSVLLARGRGGGCCQCRWCSTAGAGTPSERPSCGSGRPSWYIGREGGRGGVRIGVLREAMFCVSRMMMNWLMMNSEYPTTNGDRSQGLRIVFQRVPLLKRNSRRSPLPVVLLHGNCALEQPQSGHIGEQRCQGVRSE